MNESERAFRVRLMEVFRAEAQEHLTVLSRTLLDMESSAPTAHAGLIETAFREAHSLKGAARSVNLTLVETVCQTMEELFARLQRREFQLHSALIDALLAAVKSTEELLQCEETQTPPPAITGILQTLKKAAANQTSSPLKTTAPPAADAAAEPIASVREEHNFSKPLSEPTVAPSRKIVEPDAANVRVSTELLDSVRLKSEALVPEKLNISQRLTELQHLHHELAEWPKRWAAIQPSVRSLADETSLTPSQTEKLRTFLEWNHQFFQEIENRQRQLVKSAQRDRDAIATKVDALLEDTRDLLMLPCAWLTDRLRQPVRDLARDLGKEARFLVEGETIELDRRILAELKTPFLHLLRNSLDHGIESPSERTRAGKAIAGTLTLAIAPVRNGRVEITLSDDGRGLDAHKLREAAVKAGIIDAAQASKLNEAESHELVFGSGISTSSHLTELSGRGLGLAIVREKTEKLGGRINLESTPGKGTLFRLSLPSSLATFRGVVARAGDRHFVVPLANTLRVIRIPASQITTLENRESISFEGSSIAVLRLATLFRISRAEKETPTMVPLLIVTHLGSKLALAVDEVCGEQEVAPRKLSATGAALPHLSGATPLSNGALALILDLAGLWRLGSESPAAQPSLFESQNTPQSRKRVLVADDSITSRTLLSGILESAGYEVEVAVDGLDAFAKLRSARFDLVVSDVDMPRLTGLGLTEKIRADAKLTELPVVLVTSLDSQSDRTRGLEAGANAYLVKRNFEETNLIDAVRRLL